jgi:serine/threonine-protein kinase
MRITLTVTAGPHQGREFTFAGHDLFLVGRSKRAHFKLPLKDRYFSRTDAVRIVDTLAATS